MPEIYKGIDDYLNKEGDSEINKLIKELGATSYEKGKDWKGYAVYIPVYGEVAYVGEPIVILKNEKETRFSTYDESFEYLKFEQGGQDDGRE